MKVAIRVFFVVLLFCDFVVWLIANIAKKQRAKKQHPKSNIQKATSQQSNKICLEDSTERSESNPGRSLGITNMKKATVWKTVPRLIAFTLQYHSYYLLIS